MTEYKEPFSIAARGDEFGNMAPYRRNPHRGQDWAPGEGKTIPAITAGKVTANYWSDGLGNCLVQSTEDGLWVLYAHLLEQPNLAIGHVLKLGDTVGKVGNTGTLTTGSHLHLAIAKSKSVAECIAEKLIDPIRHIEENASKTKPATKGKKK
jgi:murein DD-endopeptidase MepM/ murein hydrolase activator NlpD